MFLCGFDGQDDGVAMGGTISEGPLDNVSRDDDTAARGRKAAGDKLHGGSFTAGNFDAGETGSRVEG